MEENNTVVEASVDAEQSFESNESVDTGESGVNTEVAAPASEEPKFGEALKAELARREAQLEKKYKEQYGDYDNIRSQNKYLEKRARQEGFADVQAYLQAIDEFEQRQQIEQESQRMGVDPETYAQYFQPVNQQLTELQQKVQTYEQQLTQRELEERSQQQWGSLYKEFPSLMESAKAFTEGKEPEWYNESMKGYVNRGYDPVDAYRLAHSDTISRQKEQEVLARVTGRDQRQVLPSVDQPNNVQFDPVNMTGDQIEDISRRVRNGERITF